MHVRRVRYVPGRYVQPRVSPILRFGPVKLRRPIRSPVDRPWSLTARVVDNGNVVRHRQVAHLPDFASIAVCYPHALGESAAGHGVREWPLECLHYDKFSVRGRVKSRVYRGLRAKRLRLTCQHADLHKLGRAEVLEQVSIVRIFQKISVRSCLRHVAADVGLYARTWRGGRALRTRRASRGQHASHDGVLVEPAVALKQGVQTTAGEQWPARTRRHVGDPQLGRGTVGFLHLGTGESNCERYVPPVDTPANIVQCGPFRDPVEVLKRVYFLLGRRHRADCDTRVARHSRAAVLGLVDTHTRELELGAGELADERIRRWTHQVQELVSHGRDADARVLRPLNKLSHLRGRHLVSLVFGGRLGNIAAARGGRNANEPGALLHTCRRFVNPPPISSHDLCGWTGRPGKAMKGARSCTAAS
mmetsp:Transcript_11061/g.51243  ORF Transcript_11061/g.51243 Transcript_11061/m.51243 type:complete len:418 (-) Transcript_11061:103-1356(-)